MTGSQKLVPMPPKPPNRDIQNQYEELVKTGKLKPIIDRCYPLSEVPEAFRYYATGHARGRVIIAV
jgi:NADPH:quinone reductase-like Zn-dependent oxidoreductase